jgi:SAM-dependent methyltransferase
VPGASRGADAVEWREGLAGQLPLEAEQADAVVMSLLLHHLVPEAKQAALTDAYRALHPGGWLHVADWGRPTAPCGAPASVADRGRRLRRFFRMAAVVDGLGHAGAALRTWAGGEGGLVSDRHRARPAQASACETPEWRDARVGQHDLVRVSGECLPDNDLIWAATGKEDDVEVNALASFHGEPCPGEVLAREVA